MICVLDLKVNHMIKHPDEKISPPNSPVLKLDAASIEAFIGALNKWLPSRSKNSFIVKKPLYKSKDETLIGLRIPLTNPVTNPKPIITSMNLIRENVDSRLPLAIQVVRKAINAPDRNPDVATNEPNSRGRCSGS